jgi:hypothetical protein
MEYTSFVHDNLEPYRKYGVEQLDNGTELIGQAKFIAPLAYVHSLYAPLDEHEILSMEKKLGVRLPTTIKKFYQSFNGLYIFNVAFSIYGLRNNTSRTVEASRQPFDIFTPNIDERLEDAEDNMLFIGVYRWDGSLVYVDVDSEKVFFCAQRSAAPLLQWDSFDAMLESEFNRLADIHTADGRNIPLRPTIPIGGEDEYARMIAKAKDSKNPPYWFKGT